MPDVDSKSTSGILFLFPCNRKSAIEIRNSGGGIAQLVERQLCKLEVRGSNPLASKASKAWRQNLTTGHIFGCTSGSVIPLPPVFARVVEESEDCRAVALAKADLFHLVAANAASYDSASQS